MKKLLIAIAFVFVTAAAIIFWKSTRLPASPIVVASPKPGDMIASPISVSGEARGMWYFEASFPVRVVDANGKVLGSAPAHADGDWMTENFVPFSGSVEFATPTTPTGIVVFVKDNPSGLPEHDASVEVPIRFR